MPPRIINFVAAQSDAGKTTIIENLLPLFKRRGLRVAALKGNLHHRELDLPGKDSWRFSQAGAELSGIATAENFILVGSGRGKNGIDAAVELLADFDLVIIEGNKQSKNPKIEVVRSAINPEPLLMAGTIALISDRQDLEPGLPVFDLEDYGGVVDFLINDQALKPEKDTPAAELTHFDRQGRPRMVDVSAKATTLREAYARGEITMASQTLSLIRAGGMAKGDVLGVAQVAAIMAVKETGRLIPMAHPLAISGVTVDFAFSDNQEAKITIGVRVRLSGQTGVEMEALTGVSIAALTIYDMCKAVDKSMVIQNIHLVEKKGGRSGHFHHEQNNG